MAFQNRPLSIILPLSSMSIIPFFQLSCLVTIFIFLLFFSSKKAENVSCKTNWLTDYIILNCDGT